VICGLPVRVWLAAAGLGAALLHLPAAAAGLEVSVETTSRRPVEDAAIILEPIGAAASTKKKRKATIVQQDREFKPYLTIVQTGTAVEFPNRDPIKHHIYSFSPAKTFEIKLYAGKPARPVVFDKPGAVALGCNIHDWMEAYVLVVDSPFFATSDARGRALIDRIPPGRYKLSLWHPRQTASFASREIVLLQKTERLALSLDVAPRVVKPRPPPDSEKY
jgi:plastocyanin